MKTIVIELFAPGGREPLARATGHFTVVPGLGKVSWEGDLSAFLKPPYSSPLPTDYFPQNFTEAVCAMAERLGLVTKVTESGRWRVFME